MAKSKLELEQDDTDYREYLEQSNAALLRGDVGAAVEFAKLSLPFIDGMIQYERRIHKRETFELDAIQLILKYAPPLFDQSALELLAETLKKYRRIEKSTTEDIAAALGRSQAALWVAHRIRTQLRIHSCEIAGLSNPEMDSIVNTWKTIGYVKQDVLDSKEMISLVTRMDEEVRAKCPECGARIRAKKAAFLSEIKCPKCKRIVACVILVDEPVAMGRQG